MSANELKEVQKGVIELHKVIVDLQSENKRLRTELKKCVEYVEHGTGGYLNALLRSQLLSRAKELL